MWFKNIYNISLCIMFFSCFSKIAVLITDGKSQDNVQEPSQRLRNLGIKIFAVGKNNTLNDCFSVYVSVSFILIWWIKCFTFQRSFCFLSGIKSADQKELSIISSSPDSQFTSFIGNFRALSTLLPLLSPRVCTASGGTYSNDGIKSHNVSKHYFSNLI